MYGLAEAHLAAEVERRGIGGYLILIRAAADEHHAEVLPRRVERLERVEDYPYALVPHHAPHEEEHRHARRKVHALRRFLDERVVHAAAREVHAVRHDGIAALIAELAQVFTRTVADRPHLVAGGDILHEYAHGLLLQKLAAHGVGDVDIELRVICKDDGHVYPLAQDARKHGGRDGTVTVDDVKAALLHLPQYLRREGHTRAVADVFGHVHAGIAQHGEGEDGVVRLRVRRRHDGGGAVLCVDEAGVIRHGVGHAVYLGRERVVYEAYVQFFHGV